MGTLRETIWIVIGLATPNKMRIGQCPQVCFTWCAQGDDGCQDQEETEENPLH
jgi:hypothetical protein